MNFTLSGKISKVTALNKGCHLAWRVRTSFEYLTFFLSWWRLSQKEHKCGGKTNISPFFNMMICFSATDVLCLLPTVLDTVCPGCKVYGFVHWKLTLDFISEHLYYVNTNKGDRDNSYLITGVTLRISMHPVPTALINRMITKQDGSWFPAQKRKRGTSSKFFLRRVLSF